MRAFIFETLFNGDTLLLLKSLIISFLGKLISHLCDLFIYLQNNLNQYSGKYSFRQKYLKLIFPIYILFRICFINIHRIKTPTFEVLCIYYKALFYSIGYYFIFLKTIPCWIFISNSEISPLLFNLKLKLRSGFICSGNSSVNFNLK